jgi:ParB family chromosome partitioning protein
MEANHPMLRTLLGTGADKSRWDSAGEVASIATKASTPKAATMTTLAAVVSAWEATIGKHSWRNPSRWDARVLGALMEWGYQPSEVERILLGEEQQPSTDADDNSADEDDTSAA